MDLQLKGRVALVAGSTKGIGRVIALTLLREGARVCITGRDDATLASAVQELSANFGENVMGAAGDMTEVAAIETVLSSVLGRWGGLEIVVANVGSGKGGPGWQQEEQEWGRIFNLNFFGSVRLAQASVPRLQSRGGSILFIASIAGIEASPAPLPYSAAKAALINYSKNLSRAVAEKGIRVNCLAPGNVLFPGGSWEQHLKKGREVVERMIASEVPQKRFGTPEEMAEFAAYLVSPNAGFATGGCYIMDGGQTRRI